MEAAGIETVSQITSEVDIFAPILQQSCIKNEFSREFSPLASITQGSPIEFTVQGADHLYLALNECLLTVHAKMTKADGTPIAEKTAGPVNLAMHSMFREMTSDFNGRLVSEPNHLYPYRAFIETLLNYSEDVQKTRLTAEGWCKDTAGQMAVTDVTGANTGLKERTTWFDKGRTVQLVGRPHVDVFQQERLLLPNVNINLKLIPTTSEFFIKCKEPGQNAAQEKYKLVIEKVTFKVVAKELFPEIELAHMTALDRGANMLIPYQRSNLKHMSIPQNQTSVAFENVFTDRLPDIAVVGLVADEDFAGSYTKNPFNFQDFGVTRVDLKRNGVPCPRFGYTPDFGDKKLYMEAYHTFQSQLGFGFGDKCVNLTPTEWATGYTLYVFKITDGPIGSGTEGPRSAASSGSARLEITLSASKNFPIKVIVFSLGLGIIKIDKHRSITVE